MTAITESVDESARVTASQGFNQGVALSCKRTVVQLIDTAQIIFRNLFICLHVNTDQG